MVLELAVAAQEKYIVTHNIRDFQNLKFDVVAITPADFFKVIKEQTMSALTIRIPESLHQNLKALAEREGVSANQFIASAVAEKMASVLTLNYLKSEAALAKRGDFEAFLEAMPNTPVEMDTDKIGR